MSQDIGIGESATVSAGVEGSPGHHRRHRRGSEPVGGRPRVRRLPGLDIATGQAATGPKGEAAFEPRSRRPHTSPTRLPQTTIDLIVELRTKLGSAGLDAGPAHHRLAPGTPPPAAGIGGLDQPPPRRGRARRHRPRPNVPNRPTSALPPTNPTNAGKPTSPTGASPTGPTPKSSPGSTTTPATHSRSPPTAASPDPSSGTFRKAYDAHGIPASTLTDNGMVFTTRLAGGKGGRNQLEERTAPPGRAPRSTPPRITRPPAAKSNGSNKPSNAGSPTNPEQRPCPNCKPSSTPSSTNTTTAAPTAPCPTAPPRPPSTPARPKADPSNPHRHPRPRPHRPRRPSRIHHPARQRTPAPHRRRPHPLPNPRPDPRPRPQHQNHQRRHRRTTPRLHPRPHQGLPTHRSPQRPHTEKAPNLT